MKRCQTNFGLIVVIVLAFVGAKAQEPIFQLPSGSIKFGSLCAGINRQVVLNESFKR